jgi:hypothetical protein
MYEAVFQQDVSNSFTIGTAQDVLTMLVHKEFLVMDEEEEKGKTKKSPGQSQVNQKQAIQSKACRSFRLCISVTYPILQARGARIRPNG